MTAIYAWFVAYALVVGVGCLLWVLAEAIRDARADARALDAAEEVAADVAAWEAEVAASVDEATIREDAAWRRLLRAVEGDEDAA